MVFALKEPNYATPYLPVRFLGFVEALFEHVPVLLRLQTCDMLTQLALSCALLSIMSIIILKMRVKHLAIPEED